MALEGVLYDVISNIILSDNFSCLHYLRVYSFFSVDAFSLSLNLFLSH